MAKVKEVYEVRGINLSEHEKRVYDKVMEMGVVNYNDIASAVNISVKSAIATLARLDKTHGLLSKNEPVKVATYEVATDVNQDE